MSTRSLRLLSMWALVGLAPAACTIQPLNSTSSADQPAVPAPNVKIEGTDGTVMNGQLLNGSISIVCGQGELMLLTDRIYSITFEKEGDSIMSGSVKVFGKIEDTELRLRTEHGIFRLKKENLRTVVFTDAPASAIAAAESNSQPRYASASASKP